MESALRRIAEMLEAFADAVAAWFATGAWRPETWPGVTWVLVAALVALSWLLAWRRRTPRALAVRPPQLLVTSGELVPDGAEDPEPRPSGRRRRRADPEVLAPSGTFAMTVSNLSRYPVQLLEVALRDGRRGAPRVAIVEAVVPAMGSVSVSGRVPLGLRGDGWMDVYCYAAAPKVKMHRHRVEVVWEPWAARFKVAPLEQVSVPARRLASDEPDARFLEDDLPEPTDHGVVAGTPPERPPERRDAPSPNPVRPAPIADRPTTPPPSSPPASGAPGATPSAVVAPSAAASPSNPAPSAAPSATSSAVSSAARSADAPTPRTGAASSAAPRSRAASATPRGTAQPAGAPSDDALGVPRIATPPVGVAVAGRGGTSARTADGLPIGRPTIRPERGPTEPAEPSSDPVRAPARGAVRDPVPGPAEEPVADRASERPARTETSARPAPPVRATPEDRPAVAGEDAAPPEPPARRRPRLEFPDEF